MDSYETQFIYVDGFFQRPTGKASPWHRMKVSEIANLKKKAENFNVFATIQQFSSPQKAEGELQYAPLYFDLDISEKYPFPIVIEDAKKIIDFFTVGYDVHQSFIRIFFSGLKGIHILIHPKILNVQPDAKLNLIFKSVALYLENFLDLKTLDSKTIYSSRRMLRLVDSIHHKSGLFKIELSHKELNLSEEEIRKLAKAPRGSLYEDSEFEGILPGESASSFYKHFVNLFKQEEIIGKLKPQISIRNTGDTAICVKDLMENHIKKSGIRNLATMTLACYFKDQGFSEQETIALLEPWALRTPKEFTSARDERVLKASTISCIKSVFANNDYHFVCSVMRSLGDIKCEYAQCEIANEEDQKPEKEIVVHLSEASEACYLNKKLKTKVLVSGKDTSPFIVPKRIQIICKPDLGKEDSKCQSCKLAKQGGRFEFILSEKDPLLIECIQCSTSQQIQVLKRLSETSKCPRVKISTLETGNIEELELTPELDRQINVEGNEEYVTRKAFYIGHNMLLNQELEICCYTHADPKTQHAVHIFSQYSSAETSLNGFKMNDDLKKKLDIFQPKSNQTIQDKFLEIHKDLEYNIHHIWQRTPLFIAFDLTYHSVLNFKFQNEILKKGWAELLVIGDSGQAKTVASQRIAEHYGFGFRISGEGARRTGLAYTWHQTANRWSVSFGSIPRNDRRLVFIDEAGGIDEEEISKLTDMRSEGIADARGGPIPARTYARTRLIWMSNTKSGTPLSEYSYPVESIKEIFKKTEDIRRFDLAIAVRSGDVPDEVIHQLISKREQLEHLYTSFLCKNLILWAWTRKIQDVVIEEETEQEILSTSMAMSQKYSSLIPLVEPSDQRNKIARLSVAAACRLFSTDKTGEKVIVKKEHVQFVKNFLESQYNSVSLDYLSYSTINKRAPLEDEYSKLSIEFQMFSDSLALAETLLKMPTIRSGILEQLLDLDKEDIKKILRFFHTHDLIQVKGKSLKKTAAGVNFLKRFKNEFKDKKPINELEEIGDYFRKDDDLSNL